MNGRDIIDLYDAHARDLVGFFAARTHDPQLALDLLGETFLAAFEHRARCRASTERQRAAWLYRIAANELSDHYRSGASEGRAMRRLAGELRAPSDREIVAIERLAASSELEERVIAAFGDLSIEQQEAVRLRVIEERSYAELSSELGVSQQGARARVSRGLRALRWASQRETKERP